MGIYDTVAGAFDYAAGSTDEAVARQFDDVEGGGVSDETFAVLDPTRAASAQTEQDLRHPALAGPSPLTLLSDAMDRSAGVTPPQDREDDPLRTPSGDGQWFSGDDPVTFTTENIVQPILPDAGLLLKVGAAVALLVSTIVAVGAFAKGAGEGATS